MRPKWQDVLTSLDVAEVGEEDRKELLVDVVMCVLFRIVLERKEGSV